MDEPSTIRAPRRGYEGELADALALIEKIVVDGLKHGHFDYSITCETGTGGRRLLIVKAGKSHKFSITEPDVPE
jgi:hypothetical protein